MFKNLFKKAPKPEKGTSSPAIAKPPQPAGAVRDAREGAVKAIRSFVATTGILIDPRDQLLANMGDQIFQYALGLMRQNPNFERLYHKAADAPHKRGFGKGASSDDLADCFLAWQKQDGFPAGISDLNVFVQGGDAQIPNSDAKFSWSVFVYFAQ